ncbi:glutathione S-transferase C-terminal-like protein [Mycena maculata]|uniref:Glutathione S-transferase C-terminal-like protein n=1 Tax=Mycena maculata TaxID=230809 RepID=A0AAD7N5G5_9AGAR|nr:glutathione S-transferase C-terminal-like protein [Mycena maculata]
MACLIFDAWTEVWIGPTAAHSEFRPIEPLANHAIDVPADYVHFEDNKKPSAVIARYIATLAPNSGLLSKSPAETALIDQWVHVGGRCKYRDNQRPRCWLLFPYGKPLHTTFLERQLRGLYTLEKHLSSRTFFVGERITVTDLFIAALVQRAYAHNIDTPTRAKLPNLTRHLETIVNQHALASIYGPVPVLETAPVYAPPKKEKEHKPAPPPALKA